MGGHSAWRKRLKAGLLAKQSGGAICRHRPHFGAQGIIINNRKGNIAGGNPKKKKKKYNAQKEEQNVSQISTLSLNDVVTSRTVTTSTASRGVIITLIVAAVSCILVFMTGKALSVLNDISSSNG